MGHQPPNMAYSGIWVSYDSLISLVAFFFENFISCGSGSISDIQKTSQTLSWYGLRGEWCGLGGERFGLRGWWYGLRGSRCGLGGWRFGLGGRDLVWEVD